MEKKTHKIAVHEYPKCDLTRMDGEKEINDHQNRFFTIKPVPKYFFKIFFATYIQNRFFKTNRCQKIFLEPVFFIKTGSTIHGFIEPVFTKKTGARNYFLAPVFSKKPVPIFMIFQNRFCLITTGARTFMLFFKNGAGFLTPVLKIKNRFPNLFFFFTDLETLFGTGVC